jgi:hypothetical protein
MRKFKTSLIFLTAISLSGCGYDPIGEKIKRWDGKLSECRQYEIIQTKPEMLFKHVATLPPSACDGIWGVDSPLMAKFVRHWNANQKD